MKPAIDLDHLNQYVFGDDALLDEILAIFTEQAAHWVSRLDPMQGDEDWRNAAHTLKGAARGIGSWAIADLCEEGEELIGGVPEKTARRRTLIDQLRLRVDAATTEAQELRERL